MDIFGTERSSGISPETPDDDPFDEEETIEHILQQEFPSMDFGIYILPDPHQIHIFLFDANELLQQDLEARLEELEMKDVYVHALEHIIFGIYRDEAAGLLSFDGPEIVSFDTREDIFDAENPWSRSLYSRDELIEIGRALLERERAPDPRFLTSFISRCFPRTRFRILERTPPERTTLLLIDTPASTAAEIKRVLSSVTVDVQSSQSDPRGGISKP